VKLPTFGAASGRNVTLRIVSALGNSSSTRNPLATISFYRKRTRPMCNMAAYLKIGAC
jgi:hypothetical protein